MKNTKHQRAPNFAHAEPYHFKGLDDWFEVFRAGDQTDSQGNTKTWTQDDLDSMVANHTADTAAPLVVGHPKTDDPAYGWTDSLKRDGDLLLAKAANVVPEFESAVEAKMYRNRSVSVVPVEGGGYKLRHIGFLGAVAPAVPGLKDIAFNDADNAEIYEFAVDDAIRGLGWRFSSIGRVFRNFKNWFIAEQGVEAADQMFPEYVLDELNETSSSVRADLKTNSDFSVSNSDSDSHASDTTEEPAVSEFTQEQLDEAVNKAVETATAPLNTKINDLESAKQSAEFDACLTESKTLIDGLVSDGNLLPAQVVGVAEFMANLRQGDAESFEFSVGEGDNAETKKVSRYEFMETFLKGFGKQIEFNQRHAKTGDDTENFVSSSFSAPDGTVVNEDRAELDRKALEYSKQHNVDYVTALNLVSEEG